MITFLTAQKALSAAWSKTPILLPDMQNFAKQFDNYLKGAKDGESEEYHKNLIAKLLENTFYHGEYAVNTKDRKDLVIYSKKGSVQVPSLIIEAKSPVNTAEMFGESNLNCKALQECVYYFMQEAITFQNKEIQHIIITNYYDWYIFDAHDFAFFIEDKDFVEDFNKFEKKQFVFTKTADFYKDIAKKEIDKWILQKNICVTHFTPHSFSQNYEDLIPLYKLLSPEHLLRKRFSHDANSLDQNFYEELLYIIGLVEKEENGKTIITRKSAQDREKGSLLECAIYELEDEFPNENECFEMAMKLVITWVNRLLFLKLVESQQIAYQKSKAEYKFLTKEKLPSFSDLNSLFFKVLGKKIQDRDDEVKTKFSTVPYLNSSLFEVSDEEKISSLRISGIKQKPMKMFSHTVLKTQNAERKTGYIDNLDYILSFLDAYDFSSERIGGITKETKTLINSSVLGLLFEKINGYKDGSFFTPAFITEYMAKECVERAIVQKFNDAKKWNCKTIDDVADSITDRNEANAIFNTIRVLDPSVGSGHFLVAVLNRLLFSKWYLRILQDKSGKLISKTAWEMKIENDEIFLFDCDSNKDFAYNPHNSELQRVQETLFNEKKTLIENCLFGVDINPASVYICRLRLWIELLKNSYYKIDDSIEKNGYASLETLPNIDINIKCGNSLVAKYDAKIGESVLNRDSKRQDKEITALIKKYREAVSIYKNDSDKFHKHIVDDTIKSIKAKLGEAAQLSLFEEATEQNENESIYSSSMEWALEFPEVLDDNGAFLGFDIVIGNPPYMILTKNNTENELLDFYINTFSSIKKSNSKNIFTLFIERGISLANEKGLLSLIVPEGLFKTRSYTDCVNIMEENGTILQTVTFEKFVFEKAITGSLIFLFKKSFEDCISESFHFDTALKLHKQEILKNPLLEKIRENTVELQSIAELFKGMVIKNRNTTIFENKGKCKDTILFGKSITKWAIKATYYTDFETLTIIGGTKKKEKYKKAPRILIRRTGDTLCCAYLTQEALSESTLYSLWSKDNEIDTRFLLALLNSTLMNYYNKAVNITNQQAFPQILMTDLQALPIKKPSCEQQQKIVALVDEILFKTLSPNTREKLEKDIDTEIYNLYGLTQEEIKSIEKE